MQKLRNLFFGVVLASFPVFARSKSSLKDFRIINKAGLKQNIEELVKDKEVGGFICHILLQKTKKRKRDVSQNLTIYFVPSFNEILSDSEKQAFFDKYNKGIVDSVVAVSELRRLRDPNIVYSRDNHRVIVTEKKFASSTHDTIYVDYSKESFIKYRSGKGLESKAFYEEKFPRKKR